LDSDIQTYGEEIADIKIKDLEFVYIDKADVAGCAAVKQFIERYEWLGKMPVWVTHRFAAYYKNIMVAAVVMATPNRFSDILGAEYRDREKLISRGATASFAPKNVGSWIIMKSIAWMAKNTEFVLFTAYADPTAKELGTIYQACNFYYLGNSFGGTTVYLNSDGTCYGSSYFSQRSVIKRAAIRAGITWDSSYVVPNASKSKTIINWNAMSEDTKTAVKEAVNEFKQEYKKVAVPSKHKYAYVLGRTAQETKKLRKLLETTNHIFPYPKQRGE